MPLDLGCTSLDQGAVLRCQFHATLEFLEQQGCDVCHVLLGSLALLSHVLQRHTALICDGFQRVLHLLPYGSMLLTLLLHGPIVVLPMGCDLRLQLSYALPQGI